MTAFPPSKNLIIISMLCICFSFSCSTLYHDRFNNNNNNWALKQTDIFDVKIADGKLKVEKFKKNKEYFGCLWYNKTIPNFNSSLDFSIQFDVKITKALDDYNQFDFSWGIFGKTNQFYNFSYNTSDSFRFNKFTSFEMPTKTWTRDPSFYKKNLIRTDSYNHVKILQKSNLCTIYFNDVIVFKQLIVPIYGNQIGFQHCTKTAWELDNLVIKNE